MLYLNKCDFLHSDRFLLFASKEMFKRKETMNSCQLEVYLSKIAG